MLKGCPICGSSKWKYEYYTEEYWGIVEQHGRCDTCGYRVEQAYSGVIGGFELDRKKGYKIDGRWYGKNKRKRKRMKRKYNIKHTNDDRIFNWI